MKQYFLERMQFNHNNRRSVFMALRRHPGSWAANTRLRFWMLDVTCRAMEVDGWKGTPRSRTSRYHLFDRTQRAGQVSACARAQKSDRNSSSAFAADHSVSEPCQRHGHCSAKSMSASLARPRAASQNFSQHCQNFDKITRWQIVSHCCRQKRQLLPQLSVGSS